MVTCLSICKPDERGKSGNGFGGFRKKIFAAAWERSTGLLHRLRRLAKTVFVTLTIRHTKSPSSREAQRRGDPDIVIFDSSRMR